MFLISKKINEFFIKIKKYKLCGIDEYGNKYYTSPCLKKRMCVYNATPEVSKIPPEWYIWMYKSADESNQEEKFSWQKDHIPNTTGSTFAYHPKNSILNIINTGIRHSYKKYKPWNFKK